MNELFVQFISWGWLKDENRGSFSWYFILRNTCLRGTKSWCSASLSLLSEVSFPHDLNVTINLLLITFSVILQNLEICQHWMLWLVNTHIFIMKIMNFKLKSISICEISYVYKFGLLLEGFICVLTMKSGTRRLSTFYQEMKDDIWASTHKATDRIVYFGHSVDVFNETWSIKALKHRPFNYINVIRYSNDVIIIIYWSFMI